MEAGRKHRQDQRKYGLWKKHEHVIPSRPESRLTWSAWVVGIWLYETASAQVRNAIIFIARRNTQVEEEILTGGRRLWGILAFVARWDADELSNALHKDTGDLARM